MRGCKSKRRGRCRVHGSAVACICVCSREGKWCQCVCVCVVIKALCEREGVESFKAFWGQSVVCLGKSAVCAHTGRVWILTQSTCTYTCTYLQVGIPLPFRGKNKLEHTPRENKPQTGERRTIARDFLTTQQCSKLFVVDFALIHKIKAQNRVVSVLAACLGAQKWHDSCRSTCFASMCSGVLYACCAPSNFGNLLQHGQAPGTSVRTGQCLQTWDSHAVLREAAVTLERDKIFLRKPH